MNHAITNNIIFFKNYSFLEIFNICCIMNVETETWFILVSDSTFNTKLLLFWFLFHLVSLNIKNLKKDKDYEFHPMPVVNITQLELDKWVFLSPLTGSREFAVYDKDVSLNPPPPPVPIALKWTNTPGAKLIINHL